MQGVALQASINPNPFFVRRDFSPLPKPLANLWQGDVIDYGDWSPPSRFWYGSLAFVPTGFAIILYAQTIKGLAFFLYGPYGATIILYLKTPRGVGARSPHERSRDEQAAFMVVI